VQLKHAQHLLEQPCNCAPHPRHGCAHTLCVYNA
jgi:hypothetical protein